MDTGKQRWGRADWVGFWICYLLIAPGIWWALSFSDGEALIEGSETMAFILGALAGSFIPAFCAWTLVRLGLNRLRGLS